MRTWWPCIPVFALTSHTHGAAFIESFVNYPSWRLIDANEFLRYHHLRTKIVTFMVEPALSATIFTALMLKWRPDAIPLWPVWVALALQVVVWVSTAAVPIPIQMQFGAKGSSEDALVELIASNSWFRIPMGLGAALFIWLTHQVFSRSQKTQRGPIGG